MRIFITGATGVVGRRLVPLLARAGHHVTALARSAGGRAELERQGVTTAEVNLFDREAVRRALADQDVVVNLATHIPPPSRMLLPWSWRENDRLRRDASAILVDAALRENVSRFVQESFAPIYADRGANWIDEATPMRPVRTNRSVLDAEASGRRFSGNGRAGIVLRFGAFYGPDAFQTRELVKAVRKGWAPAPGPPDAYISSVSHDDAATAAASSLELPAGIYNVVDDEPVTHRQYVDSLAATLGVPPPKLPPAWVTALLGPLGTLAERSLRISNRKIRSASSWTPRYPSVFEGWKAVLPRLGE